MSPWHPLHSHRLPHGSLEGDRGDKRGVLALNAWCELSVRNLSGRRPRSKVGLPPDPEGKGTDLCSTWTPSSPHSTLWSTTSASPTSPNRDAPAPRPPSPRVRLLSWLSSPAGLDSPASETSTATPRDISEAPSPPCPTARSSTGSCAPVQTRSRRWPCTWRGSWKVRSLLTRPWTPRRCPFAMRNAGDVDGLPDGPTSAGPTAWA